MEVVFIRHGQPEWDRDGLAVDRPSAHRARAPPGRGHGRASVRGRSRSTSCWCRRSCGPSRPPRRSSSATGHRARDAAVAGRDRRRPVWDGTPPRSVEAIFAEERRRRSTSCGTACPEARASATSTAASSPGCDSMLDDAGANRSPRLPPLWRLEHPARRIVVVSPTPAPTPPPRPPAGHPAGAVGVGALRLVPRLGERGAAACAIAAAHSFSLFRFSDTSHLPDHLHTR